MLIPMPLTGAEGGVMMSEQNQDEVTLRELAIRLLSPRYPGAESMQVTDLPPGQLSPHPPIELSLPPDVRLIGSVMRGQDATTLFDTNLTSEELLAFYRERMVALSWTEQLPPPQQQSGFVHAMPQRMAHTLFFASSHGLITASERSAEPGSQDRGAARAGDESKPAQIRSAAPLTDRRCAAN
jgi:hypothetical protein